jgi:general secretion pathway protein E
MDSPILDRLISAVKRPHGIVLVTGPTGSGKTTTLYALVEHLQTGREKIVTIEDPVEYQLRGVPQVPVNEKLGVTFATALRAMLRQDPDIILVGEIRDAETAEVATQAALTGHLVLSTLHTNDAAGALTRLAELGVPPYLVASTVQAVLAQRLVRTVCNACAKPIPLDIASAQALSLIAQDVTTFMHGQGCPRCRETGYYGRAGIYELLIPDDALRAEIVLHGALADIRGIAIRQGMHTLANDGFRGVRNGITTPEEVLRVTAGQI